MAQNTSSAVMAQRVEPHDSLDFFPTPPWATRALCEFIRPYIRKDRSLDNLTPGGSVWDPCCGQGHMVRPLAEFFEVVHASDVHNYGPHLLRDFLWPGADPVADWIIFNPPFRLAADFIRCALDRTDHGVAALVRTSFLEGVGRHRELFKPTPPRWILQFAERVPMFKNRLDPKGSTATSYAWFVWLPGSYSSPVEFDWIPPCRKRLERPGDYEAAA